MGNSDVEEKSQGSFSLQVCDKLLNLGPISDMTISTVQREESSASEDKVAIISPRGGHGNGELVGSAGKCCNCLLQKYLSKRDSQQTPTPILT